MFERKKKLKRYSVEKIADLYLAALGAGRDIHLPALLDEQGVFHNAELIVSSLALLEGKGLTKRIEESLYLLNYKPGVTWDNISGKTTRIEQYELTDEGMHFVKAGQEVDEKGAAERATARSKRIERFTNAAIAFGTSILTMFLKWYFIDKK